MKLAFEHYQIILWKKRFERFIYMIVFCILPESHAGTSLSSVLVGDLERAYTYIYIYISIMKLTWP